jgi:hypothetical protein
LAAFAEIVLFTQTCHTSKPSTCLKALSAGPVEALSNDNQGIFVNFRVLVCEPESPDRMRDRDQEKSKNLGRMGHPDWIGTALDRREMNARPEIRQKLIEQKLRKWCRMSKYPDPVRPASGARRNFWRLIAAHPQIAERLGYTATSVYEL